jgi:xanthine dehydrogenase YagR molybdenum-binding subunit
VVTNAGPQAPLRAPGWPQGAFAIESAIDEMAYKLNLDPMEFRRKNESSPVRKEQYDIGAKAIGWERPNKQPGEGSAVKSPRHRHRERRLERQRQPEPRAPR